MVRVLFFALSLSLAAPAVAAAFEPADAPDFAAFDRRLTEVERRLSRLESGQAGATLPPARVTVNGVTYIREGAATAAARGSVAPVRDRSIRTVRLSRRRASLSHLPPVRDRLAALAAGVPTGRVRAAGRNGWASSAGPGRSVACSAGNRHPR
jgi:hypothetical protein